MCCTHFYFSFPRSLLMPSVLCPKTIVSYILSLYVCFKACFREKHKFNPFDPILGGGRSLTVWFSSIKIQRKTKNKKLFILLRGLKIGILHYLSKFCQSSLYPYIYLWIWFRKALIFKAVVAMLFIKLWLQPYIVLQFNLQPFYLSTLTLIPELQLWCDWVPMHLSNINHDVLCTLIFSLFQ